MPVEWLKPPGPQPKLPGSVDASKILSTAGQVAGKLLDELTDPSLNTALGPQAGLQVTPAMFQSIEQEGRWKPAAMLDTSQYAGRVLELKQQTANGENARGDSGLQLPYAPLLQCHAKLFTIKVKGAGLRSPMSVIWSLATKRAGDSPCVLTVDATWWSDGLEIFAGFAGLADAKGFGSAFNTTANVALQAIPFGNYFPASVFVTWTGWINPIGPAYYEFRGGIVLNADGSNSAPAGPLAPVPEPDQTEPVSFANPPAYMTAWVRDQSDVKPQVSGWTPDEGFVLSQP